MECAECGATFTPKHPRGRFCTDRCRARAWKTAREREVTAIEETLARALERVRKYRERTRQP
jgi:hypothetical protein